MAPAIFHKRALDEIRALPRAARRAIGAAIWELQQGRTLVLPLSRPMPGIGVGVSELRVRGVQTAVRVVYCLRPGMGVLILNAFVKKTRAMPRVLVTLAQRRLRELVYEEN